MPRSLLLLTGGLSVLAAGQIQSRLVEAFVGV